MTGAGLSFVYRDFWDVPRAVVVRTAVGLLLLDCAIDVDSGEFPEFYEVFRLPDDMEPRLDSMSWTDLRHHGERIGSLPIASVHFDATRRCSIDSGFVNHIMP